MKLIHIAIAAPAMMAAIIVQLLAAAQAGTKSHNVVLFVPDGLRAAIVSEETAPKMAALRKRGVDFQNSHSLFPTFTTANASAMATGHYLGDTGDFSNAIYVGRPVKSAGGTIVPFLESDPVLGEVDEIFAGNYLDETTILAAARKAGLGTAAIGKLGPALIFDHTDRSGAPTIIIDDQTGTPRGIPLSDATITALKAAGLPLATPPRGDNGDAGSFSKSGTKSKPGTNVPNSVQQDYFVDVAAKAVLPLLQAAGRPFVLIFWSRDPDGTQHNQGDSPNDLWPGINGPTSLAAIRNADNDLGRLEAALAALGLTEETDIIVAADHGFATIAKETKTSPAAKWRYDDVPQGLLPVGFLALDLASALGLPLYDPSDHGARVEAGRHPRGGHGIIGRDPAHPDAIVAANGGSDLIYLPVRDRKLAKRIVGALLEQDYVSGIFVDDALGRFAGTLPLSAINLMGAASTPRPAIVVNFRSFPAGCDQPLKCTAEIADSGLQQGQGMHGGFSRAETANFMAAVGPDFKRGFVDTAPVSNADVGRTIAQLLRLKITDKGQLVGRVIGEAMVGGSLPSVKGGTLAGAKAANGLATILNYQSVGGTRYFDAAGFAGRTVGLAEP